MVMLSPSYNLTLRRLPPARGRWRGCDFPLQGAERIIGEGADPIFPGRRKWQKKTQICVVESQSTRHALDSLERPQQPKVVTPSSPAGLPLHSTDYGSALLVCGEHLHPE